VHKCINLRPLNPLWLYFVDGLAMGRFGPPSEMNSIDSQPVLF
jgi:hypothetical protein